MRAFIVGIGSPMGVVPAWNPAEIKMGRGRTRGCSREGSGVYVSSARENAISLPHRPVLLARRHLVPVFALSAVRHDPVQYLEVRLVAVRLT